MDHLETLLNAPKSKKKKQSEESRTDLKRCAAYIRVSTEEQEENPEGSIRNQEERIRQALQFKNSNSQFGELSRVFIDRGLSGKDMNRPELREMLKLVSNGEIDQIIVSDLSRLSRSIRDFSQMWDFLQRSSCGLWSLRENFDTSTAAGEMMLFSIMSFAQFERKQTAERVSANFQSRASRGLHNGGCLPFGYTQDPEKRGHLMIMESEAVVVRAAFLALIRLGSIAGAAKWLNEAKHTFDAPYRGGAGKGPRLQKFNVGNLTYLLNNPAYVGIRHYRLQNGKFQDSKAAWPAIVDETTFEMAKKVMENSKRKYIKAPVKFPFLLSGKVFCEQCGQVMVGKSATGATKKVPYYEHGSQLRREACIPKDERPEKCKPFRVQAKVLEKRVFEEIQKFLDDPTLSEKLFRKFNERANERPQAFDQDAFESRLGTIEKNIQSLVNRITELQANLPATVFYKEIERLQAEKKDLEEARISAMKTQRPIEVVKPMNYERFLVRMKRMVDSDNSSEARKAVVTALIHRVKIHEKGFRLSFYLGSGQISKSQDVISYASPKGFGQESKIKKGEALATPSFSLDKNILSASSLQFVNGGPCPT